ncbi:hypothetical protein GCM10010129_11220 [Streptomyces fumigatiscleroticus]|nr:hypothetical protein GCM10010129_11220 [Streptomyces fumigatiscleroticus]
MSTETLPRALGRLRRGLTRAALHGLALAVVATPFAAAWQYDARHRAVSAQAPPPDAVQDARPRAVGARHAAAPVVLAYHDVAPHSASRYTVTPERLDAQLAALRAAGYRTLSSREFARFLRTGRPPAPRSVYLTFDDGTRGLWAHADPILARHRMKAAAYLITGAVGTHRPYYLSWPEVDRMAGSGRWDFQAHTHLGHRRARVDASGRRGSVLANRVWLPGAGRLETEAEYRRRVRADLGRSLRAFRAHGLPPPRLFAYPFSEAVLRTNLTTGGTSFLRRLLAARFTAALTNTTRRPLPAGPRAAAAGQVQRLEVLGTTTADGLLHLLRTWTSSAPGDVPDPLGHPGQWQFPGSPPGTGLEAVTGDGARRGGYASAEYRPLATADWSSYRVRASARDLRSTDTSVSVTVRHGSLYPCTVTVGANTVRLTERTPGGHVRTTTRRLGPSPGHRLDMRVTPRAVRVAVDDVPLIDRRTAPAAAAHAFGGIALGVRNDTPGTPWPRFAALRVSG